MKAQHGAMGRILLVEYAKSCKENQVANRNNILCIKEFWISFQVKNFLK